MQLHKKFLCKQVRQNNGVVQVLFTLHGNIAQENEEHVLINLHRDPRSFTEGKSYWIDIQPAFPFDPS